MDNVVSCEKDAESEVVASAVNVTEKVPVGPRDLVAEWRKDCVIVLSAVRVGVPVRTKDTVRVVFKDGDSDKVLTVEGEGVRVMSERVCERVRVTVTVSERTEVLVEVPAIDGDSVIGLVDVTDAVTLLEVVRVYVDERSCENDIERVNERLRVRVAEASAVVEGDIMGVPVRVAGDERDIMNDDVVDGERVREGDIDFCDDGEPVTDGECDR